MVCFPFLQASLDFLPWKLDDTGNPLWELGEHFKSKCLYLLFYEVIAIIISMVPSSSVIPFLCCKRDLSMFMCGCE